MSHLITILFSILIGTITNHIAIKRLFRPYKKWKLFKRPLPLTPGLIPAQQKKLAHSIARSFEENFLSQEDLIQALKSHKVKKIIDEKVDAFINSLGPLASMIQNIKPKIIEKIMTIIEKISREIQNSNDWSIYQKITSKINAMGAKEMEALVLSIAKKHFHYITIFGGILGGIIGIIHLIVFSS